MMEFPTLAGLATHLLQDAVGGFKAVHSGLEAAATLLEKEAKAEFGVYQGAAGPFGAWPQLAASTKEDRVSKGFTENDPLLRTGGLRDSIVHETEQWEATVGSEDPIMLWQENGTAKMPPRPVLGPALFRNADKVVQMIGQSAVHGLCGEKVVPTAKYLLGGLDADYTA